MESTSIIYEYVDKLIAYAKDHVGKQLDVNIVRILYHLCLWDINPFKYTIARLFVKVALENNLFNLIQVLFVDLHIREFDIIVKECRYANTYILKWFIVNYKLDIVKSIKAKWLCTPPGYWYDIYDAFEPGNPSIYDKKMIQILLSIAPIDVVREAYLLSRTHYPRHFPIYINRITACREDWDQIDWKEMCIRGNQYDIIDIFENNKIVENNLIPLAWAKTHVRGYCTDSFPVRYFNEK